MNENPKIKKKPIRCPGEVFEVIKETGFDKEVTEDRARRALIEYRMLQIMFQKWIDSSISNIPPCFDCRPIIFFFCEKTGTECGTFKKYCATNKIEVYLDDPKLKTIE